MAPAVLPLVFLVIVLYTGQTFFNKLYSISRPGRVNDATCAFNMMYGVIVALATWIYNGFRLTPDALTLVFGLLNGAALFLYNHSAIHAAQSGPYTLQSMMSSFGSILPPLAVAMIVWGDRLRLVQAAGIVLMLVAFVLYNIRGGRGFSGIGKGFVWFFLVFLMNGVYSAVNDAQQRMEAGAHRQDMIIVTFLTAAVISAVYALVTRRGRIRQAFEMPPKALLFAILSSLCAAAAINALMISLRYVPSSLLYPMVAGGLLIMTTTLSRVVLREKLSGLQYAAILAAVCGLVLTNL